MERLTRRSHATGLRWALLCLVGVGVGAVACGDDDSAPVSPGKRGTGRRHGGRQERQRWLSHLWHRWNECGGYPGHDHGGAAALSLKAGRGMPAAPAVGECARPAATCSAVDDEGLHRQYECAPWLTCVSACDTACVRHGLRPDPENVARIFRGVYDCFALPARPSARRPMRVPRRLASTTTRCR